MGNTHIVHIISYLACNVCHVLHIFVLLVDIICIGHILQIFVLVMNIIYIDHIARYLARSVCAIFHIYSSSVSDWCITSFLDFNLIHFSITSSVCLVCFVVDCKLNPNPIRIYVSTFITSIKGIFIFRLNFRFGVLYTRVICVLYKLVLVGTMQHDGIKVPPWECSLQCIGYF